MHKSSKIQLTQQLVSALLLSLEEVRVPEAQILPTSEETWTWSSQITPSPYSSRYSVQLAGCDLPRKWCFLFSSWRQPCILCTICKYSLEQGCTCRSSPSQLSSLTSRLWSISTSSSSGTEGIYAVQMGRTSAEIRESHSRMCYIVWRWDHLLRRAEVSDICRQKRELKIDVLWPVMSQCLANPLSTKILGWKGLSSALSFSLSSVGPDLRIPINLGLASITAACDCCGLAMS